MDISIRCIDKSDISDVARLADNIAIAQMTANLPYPYTSEHAKIWLDYVQNNKNEHVFAVLGDGEFMGVVGLVHEPEHERAELGYWLGQNYWNKKVMTTAAGMAVAYAFTMLGVQKIYSRCFAPNKASQRVLEKNGFVFEGCQRAHHIRMGVMQDVFRYGLLRSEYEKCEPQQSV
jgi:RimJ/RimL family protein N-acetyltransferase